MKVNYQLFLRKPVTTTVMFSINLPNWRVQNRIRSKSSFRLHSDISAPQGLSEITLLYPHAPDSVPVTAAGSVWGLEAPGVLFLSQTTTRVMSGTMKLQLCLSQPALLRFETTNVILTAPSADVWLQTFSSEYFSSTLNERLHSDGKLFGDETETEPAACFGTIRCWEAFWFWLRMFAFLLWDYETMSRCWASVFRNQSHTWAAGRNNNTVPALTLHSSSRRTWTAMLLAVYNHW